MATDNYTIKEMVTELRLDMRSHSDNQARMQETLEQVLEQARKTNGRVTETEVRVRTLENWRSIIVGAISIVTFIGLPNIIEAIVK